MYARFKCPKCGKIINRIIEAFHLEPNYSEFKVTKLSTREKKEINKNFKQISNRFSEYTYHCPKCFDEIVYTEDKAWEMIDRAWTELLVKGK